MLLLPFFGLSASFPKSCHGPTKATVDHFHNYAFGLMMQPHKPNKLSDHTLDAIHIIHAVFLGKWKSDSISGGRRLI